MLIRPAKLLSLINMCCGTRTFKNFGHVRQSVPMVTKLWHGFLVFSFVGLALDWESIYGIITGTGGWKVPVDVEDLAGEWNVKKPFDPNFHD